jgi:hypothetical protein
MGRNKWNGERKKEEDEEEDGDYDEEEEKEKEEEEEEEERKSYPFRNVVPLNLDIFGCTTNEHMSRWVETKGWNGSVRK